MSTLNEKRKLAKRLSRPCSLPSGVHQKGIRGSWRNRRRKAARPKVRKVKAESYTTKFMIEMALPETKVGNGALKHEPLLPTVNTQAGMSGVSKKTMVRARRLAVNALADATEKCLSSLASSASPVRAVKVSWDETALRFYCPEETLKCIIGNMHVHPRRVVSRRRRRADGSGGQEGQPVVASQGGPSYVVQVMQVSNAALIGDVSGEIPCRPTLCASTSAADLHHALKPWVRTYLLRNPGAEPPPASQLLGLAADSHPSNKLLVTQIAQDTPQGIPILDLMCLGHQLSLAADDVLTAMRKDIDIINPMFATQQLMQQLQARDQLYKAIDLDGDC